MLIEDVWNWIFGGLKKNKVNLILNVILFIKFCEKKYLGYGFS